MAVAASSDARCAASNASCATASAFDRGAARYDFMVALNPGYHRELRCAAKALAQRIGPFPHAALLDLACGSGASTQALLESFPADATVLGLDASAGMLAEAQNKTWPVRVQFSQAVAGSLDVAALGRGSYDGILCSYLFRNVPESGRDRAIAEVFALLRPGGWLVVQEYSVADSPRARRVWDAVCHLVIIPLGCLIDRNPGLYRYLWRSVISFDSVRRFADRLSHAGFIGIEHRTAPGWQRDVLHTFAAQKPEENA